MKTPHILTIGVAMAILCHSPARAADSPDEVPGLRQVAEDFIVSFNEKDAAAVAALFSEDGEISNRDGTNLISGREDIEAHYEELFAEKEAPKLAIEVSAVRLVGPGLAIEDGTFHFTKPTADDPVYSDKYTAVLQKTPNGEWQIAGTRKLGDVTDAAGNLADLAAVLKGDWTSQSGDLRVDIAFGWDQSGNYIIGQMLATRADAKPLSSTIRFGWDAARKTISCWTFDDQGGFSKADWAPAENGWIVRTEGTTAEGEFMRVNQHLTFESKDTFLWAGKDLLVDGKSLPDSLLRVVRQAPAPGIDDDDDGDAK
jgi:uncharacterized protein (TIGR02246 family)